MYESKSIEWVKTQVKVQLSRNIFTDKVEFFLGLVRRDGRRRRRPVMQQKLVQVMAVKLQNRLEIGFLESQNFSKL